MSAMRVLVVDDDPAFRAAMRKALARFGLAVEEAATGAAAVEALLSDRFDVALLDLQLGETDGLSVLRRARGSSTRVIVVTGHGTIPAAVEAMRLGASSFVQKPVDAPTLLPLLEEANRERAAAAGAFARSAGLADDLGLIGPSAHLANLRARIRRAAATDETVLITGESGVGKELVARALHGTSRRAARPFVAFNCAQAHPDLFDAELFGHVRGTFTGATRDRPGLFREAEKGTLFLDEVGELPERAQAKLLRVLETATIRPVGRDREEPVDVRVIAATNRELGGETKRGRFREDLLFRLQVLTLHVEPLRERREDIVPIAESLLAGLAAARGRKLGLSPDATEEILAYDWPGNVRELLNVLKRASVFSSGDVLDASVVGEAIRASIFGHPEARARTAPVAASSSSPPPSSPSASPSSPPPPAAPGPAGAGDGGEELSLAEAERRHVLSTFERHGGNVTKAAHALGVDRRTLLRKLRGFGRDVGEE